MKKESKKRIDLYDIGDGLTLMNLIEKNDSGKMHHITTYIGIEGNGFVCVCIFGKFAACLFFIEIIFNNICVSVMEFLSEIAVFDKAFQYCREIEMC